MYTKFRIEMAKLFGLLAVVIVISGGLLAKVLLPTLLIRAVTGGAIFAAVGYLFGRVVDQQKEIQLVELQKQKIKAKIRSSYDQATKNPPKPGDDFSPLEVEKLAKIIVDTMEK